MFCLVFKTILSQTTERVNLNTSKWAKSILSLSYVLCLMCYVLCFISYVLSHITKRKFTTNVQLCDIFDVYPKLNPYTGSIEFLRMIMLMTPSYCESYHLLEGNRVELNFNIPYLGMIYCIRIRTRGGI